MDIANTPEGAAESAAPATSPTIRREDYRAPDWLVPEVALDFALGLDETRVVARLLVRRNPDGSGAQTIRLNGDGIAARSVKVDGEAINDWRMEGPDLLIELAGESHVIEVETLVQPTANSQLMGLYASNGMLCTQCEAEGFRRITFFPDRPDVLSTYRVRMEGAKDAFPVLLSNGNCTGRGEGADGAHWAEWHDPWPKPSYLFALVAGQLVANQSTFTTMGGREVDLNIWVRPGDEPRTQHAMDSLKAAMKWDEEAFGREYDLDLYNIVAVSDFNMGAMENKGLNVFNTRYVLADPETATDGDYDGVEGVIAHNISTTGRATASLAATGSSSRSRRVSRSCATSCSARTWARRRSSGSRMCTCCGSPSSPRIRGRWLIRSGRTATRKSRTSTPRPSTTRAPK